MECYIMSDMSLYSNSTPLSYGPTQPLSYNNNQKVRYDANGRPYPIGISSVPAGMTGAGFGLLGGGLAGALKKNPYMVNGIPTDNFAQLAYEKYLKKAPAVEQKAYNQSNEVIRQLDKIKTTDELKTLMNNNPEASKEVSTALNKTTEEYLSSVADTNLAANKEVIKKKLEAGNQTRYQNMKNEISRAWDNEKHKFVKPDNMDASVFKAIKRTTGNARAAFTAKCALITAAVAGVVAFAAHKIINLVKQRKQYNQ